MSQVIMGSIGDTGDTSILAPGSKFRSLCIFPPVEVEHIELGKQEKINERDVTPGAQSAP